MLTTLAVITWIVSAVSMFRAYKTAKQYGPRR